MFTNKTTSHTKEIIDKQQKKISRKTVFIYQN